MQARGALDLGEKGTRDVATTAAYASRGTGKNLTLCGRLDDVSLDDVRSLLVEIGGEMQRIRLGAVP